MPDQSTPVDPSAPPAATAPIQERPHGLYRVLAWVGIVAGVVFIVGAIFAAGVFFGGANSGWHRGGPDGSGPGRMMSGCPMMKSGAMKDGMPRGGAPEGMPGGRPGPMAPERVPPSPGTG